MTWSYEDKNLGQGGKDDVRAMIGDNAPNSPLMSDEEINFFIGMSTTLYGAASAACLALSTKFARMVDQAAGTFKDSYSQATKNFSLRAIHFQILATSSGGGMPYAGGISISDKLTQDANTDRKQPEFALGMFDSYLPVAPPGISTEEQSAADAGQVADTT